jgi:hypothetical protein
MMGRSWFCAYSLASIGLERCYGVLHVYILGLILIFTGGVGCMIEDTFSSEFPVLSGLQVVKTNSPIIQYHAGFPVPLQSVAALLSPLPVSGNPADENLGTESRLRINVAPIDLSVEFLQEAYLLVAERKINVSQLSIVQNS